MRDGRVSLRLRSYLLVKARINFCLSSYIRNVTCTLTLSDGQKIKFKSVSLSDECIYRMGYMVFDFWAHGEVVMPVIEDSVAKLRVDYFLNFSGAARNHHFYHLNAVPLLRRTK